MWRGMVRVPALINAHANTVHASPVSTAVPARLVGLAPTATSDRTASCVTVPAPTTPKSSPPPSSVLHVNTDRFLLSSHDATSAKAAQSITTRRSAIGPCVMRVAGKDIWTRLRLGPVLVVTEKARCMTKRLTAGRGVRCAMAKDG